LIGKVSSQGNDSARCAEEWYATQALDQGNSGVLLASDEYKSLWISRLDEKFNSSPTTSTILLIFKIYH
jgi:hypothetical protein